MKKILSLLILISLLHPIQAQRIDSLTCHYDHAFTLQQTISPASLFTIGAVIAGIHDLHQNIDIALRDCLQADGHKRFRIDDYMQFAPGVSVLALKSCGLESQHSWRDLTSLAIGTSLCQLVICNGLKYTLCEERPYGGVFNSFPSGHTMTAFLGAEFLRREYGQKYPAIAVTGYVVASGVAFMRMYNNRHYLGDVLAGAGLGILCTSITYWLAPKLRF